MNRIDTCLTGSSRNGDDGFVTQRFIAQLILRHLRYENRLILIANGIFYDRQLARQLGCIGCREGIQINGGLSFEISQRLMVDEEHLQGIHIRFLDGVRYSVGILLTALRGNDDLTDEGIERSLYRVHRDGLVVVFLQPAQIREVACTYRQRQRVIHRILIEAAQRLTVLVNHIEFILFGLRQMEYYYIGILSNGLILRQHFDGCLQLVLIHFYRLDGLTGLTLLGCYFRHGMNADRQFHLIEVISRIEVLKRITIEEDHTQVRISGERNKELQRISILLYTINSRHIKQDGIGEVSNRIYFMDNLYLLTIHLQLGAYLRNDRSAGRQVDLVVVITRIEGEV